MKTISLRPLLVLFAAAAGLLLLGSTCKLANKAPSVPTLTGPTTGVAGVAITFTATATDPESDSLQFLFDWGDGSTPAWTAFVASGDTITATNTYSDSGTFTVKARAKDTNGKESDWSAGHALTVVDAGPGFIDTVVGVLHLDFSTLTLAVLPTGDYLYLVREDTALLYPVRLSDRTILSPISIPRGGDDIACAPDGHHIYVACRSGLSVVSIAVPTNVIEHTVQFTDEPFKLALSADGQKLYVTGAINNALVVLNASDLSIADTIAAPVNRVCPGANGTAYATGIHRILRIDITAGVVADSMSVDDAILPALRPAGEELYVSNQQDSGYYVVRTSDFTIQRTVNAHCWGPGCLGFSPDGRYFYYSANHGLEVEDLQNHVVVGTVSLSAKRPFAVHPSGDSIYYSQGQEIDVLGKR